MAAFPWWKQKESKSFCIDKYSGNKLRLECFSVKSSFLYDKVFHYVTVFSHLICLQAEMIRSRNKFVTWVCCLNELSVLPLFYVRYCVEFQLLTITKGCLHGNSSYTHWMKYLSEGHTVCVECQHPALESRSLHCAGDGSGAKK